MNLLIDKLIKIAESEVGVREQGGNNRGERIVEYQKATWLKPDNWPWCAAFICWCLKKWLESEEVRKHFGLTIIAANAWRCKDASAFGFAKWALQAGFNLYQEDKITGAPSVLAKAGDIAIFDFSHIGIVVKDQLKLSDKIVLVEGNTNGKGERDSDTGDGVWHKERDPKLIKVLVRLIA